MAPEKAGVLDKNLQDLDVSLRARNALARRNVLTVGDLVSHSENDIRRNTPGLGKTSYAEVADLVYDLKLEFKA